MAVTLSTALESSQAVPYFLWDEPMSVAELRRRLMTGSTEERIRLLAKVLREARDADVWRFTTPMEVRQLWPDLRIRLGRRRGFWEFLLGRWRKAGLLDE